MPVFETRRRESAMIPEVSIDDFPAPAAVAAVGYS